MQFVKKGPDIPERLLRSHEDGEVVFFCGAGISYPAGLPDFSGLVKNVCNGLGVQTTPILAQTIKENRFDIALSLVEQNEVEGRRRLREEVVRVLKPKYNLPNAKRTHEALLELATTRTRKLRLVTTNFDRIFEDSMALQPAKPRRTHCAPFLQIPKERWSGLIYLHGLIPTNPTEEDLNQLVITSGDFGLAYLIERWASRFVSELFKRYTVCFVGYSVNDPVLRYMTDAIAADKQMGESAPEMFALAGYKNTQNKKQVEQEWKAKQITPILYKGENQHALFHETLHEWSKTYRDGVNGKCHVITRCSHLKPTASTAEDNFVGRVLWALEDPTGQPAKILADSSPTYGLEWLEEFSRNRYKHVDLNRFEIAANEKYSKDFPEYSLAFRPSPYHLASWMGIVRNNYPHGHIDAILSHLIEWLIRHYLGSPGLIHWVSKNRGGLHWDFSRALERRLQELEDWTRNGDPQLALLKAKSPNAIPSKPMRSLWRCALLGLLDPTLGHIELSDWVTHVNRDGIHPTLVANLRRILETRISLRPPYRTEENEEHDHRSMKDIAEVDVDLACGSLRPLLDWRGDRTAWDTALPSLLPVFLDALRSQMDIRAELEQITEDEDFSYIHRPSIESHSQNGGHHDWLDLISLIILAMEKLAQEDLAEAGRIAESWMTLKYPLYIRMAFHAATRGWVNSIQSMNWMIANQGHWLYSPRTKHESIQLLAYLYPRLEGDNIDALENAILAGPASNSIQDALHEVDPGINARIVRTYLEALRRRSIQLRPRAEARLAELNHSLGENLATEADEFPFWMSRSGWGRETVSIEIPRAEESWVQRIQSGPSIESQEDSWEAVCREDPMFAIRVLKTVAETGNWPHSRWGHWLRASKEISANDPIWEMAIPLTLRFPQALAKQNAEWTKEIVEKKLFSREKILEIVSAWLSLCEENIPTNEKPINQAINNPVGKLTEAVVALWQSEELRDDGKLPEDIKAYFTEIATLRSPSFRCGLLILTLHLTTIYRVDTAWTRAHLLPLMSWKEDSEVARIAWNGFLWSPRLYPPLLAEIKTPFKGCASRSSILGDEASIQYYSLLVIIGTEPRDIFTQKEIKKMMTSIPQVGVDVVAETLNRFLEGAGEQSKEYWENRIKPFFEQYFPKQQSAASERVGHAFAELIVFTADIFPTAYDLLHSWIKPYQWPDREVEKLNDHAICRNYPDRALGYLAAYMPNRIWAPEHLRTALRQIKGAKPELAQEEAFRRLAILCGLPPEG